MFEGSSSHAQIQIRGDKFMNTFKQASCWKCAHQNRGTGLKFDMQLAFGVKVQEVDQSQEAWP